MKTPEERQYFFISPCQWGCSGGYSCKWICFNSYLSVICFIWYTARYTMRWTRVLGVQHSAELAFSSTDFRLPKNLFSQPCQISALTENFHFLDQIFPVESRKSEYHRSVLHNLSKQFWIFGQVFPKRVFLYLLY